MKERPSGSKEKSLGEESLLRENERLINELNDRRKRRWISEDDYKIEREKLDTKRLEILTQPNQD